MQFVAGVLFLVLSGFFAYFAETPSDHLPFLTRAEAFFPPVVIDYLFWPVVSVALLALPVLWVAADYIAPWMSRRKLALILLCGFVFLTPVVPGVTSWTLYFACGTLGVVLIARSLEPRFGERWQHAVADAWTRITRMSWRTFLWSAVAIHLALTIAIAFSFFGGTPHVQDSIAQRFQAKIFVHRKAYVPAPPVPDAFEYSHLVIRDGRWYSVYFPAHPFIISLFERMHAAPLANPMIGVAGLLGAAALARLLAGDRLARLVVLLLLISPWWLLMHSEGMNHVTAGAALTWALVAFVKGGTRKPVVFGLVSGLLFGVAFLVRPYTPLLVGVAVLAFALWRAVVNREWRWLICTIAIAVGVIPAILLMLLYNARTTGDPLLPAYVAKWGMSIAPGFRQPLWGPPHTPLLGLRNVLADLNALDRWVLGLPVPFILLAAGVRRKHFGLLWTVPVALLIGHFAYWYVDFCFGPRYLFEALPCLMILAAIALRELWSRAPRRLAIAGAIALIAAFPVWHGIQRVYGRTYYAVDHRFAAKIAAAAPDDALVFVPTDSYGAYVWRNDPQLRHGPIFVRDLGPANAAVIAAFPQRKVIQTGSH